MRTIGNSFFLLLFIAGATLFGYSFDVDSGALRGLGLSMFFVGALASLGRWLKEDE